jgi:hypothetical protein
MDDLRVAPERVATDLSAGLQQFAGLFAGGQLTELSGELAQFMTARLMRNLDTMRAMSQCRGPAEFIELQLRWAQETFDDYMHEANRLMERNGGLGCLVGGQSDKGVAKQGATKVGAKSGA